MKDGGDNKYEPIIFLTSLVRKSYNTYPLIIVKNCACKIITSFM